MAVTTTEEPGKQQLRGSSNSGRTSISGKEMETDATSAPAAWMVTIATSKAAEQSGRVAKVGTGQRVEKQVGEARELRWEKTESSEEPEKEICTSWSLGESRKVGQVVSPESLRNSRLRSSNIGHRLVLGNPDNRQA